MAWYRPDLPSHRHSSNRAEVQRQVERDDRLFAVPRNSHSEQALTDVRDLPEPIQQELDKFFKATDELEQDAQHYPLEGPKAAVEAIKDAAKNFKKSGK
jgi:inorganic pyrophosphatase